jgi:Ca2+-binding RTX toxin-like protein
MRTAKKISKHSPFLFVAALVALLVPAWSSASAATCAGKHATIVGTAGNDHLVGKGASDVIYGGGGNDFIYGSHGRNVIHAGAGNDAISVHYGRGVVDCGPGRDVYHVARSRRKRYRFIHCEKADYRPEKLRGGLRPLQ